MTPRLFLLIVVLFAVTVRITDAVLLHVAPAGATDGPGTVEKPLSLASALERASSDTNITEILLAGGEYVGSFTLTAPKQEAATLPLLIIRSTGATLHHSAQVAQAEAVEGMPGLYRSKQIPPSDPQMWERDTRVRYKVLSNRASVAAIPASCFVDREENALYFRTSDDKPPQEHKIFLALCSINSRAFAIYRSNVTVEGLSFRDYVGNNALAFQTYGDNLTIRRCQFDNCYLAWGTSPNSRNCVMEECTGTDVAQPVYSYADHVTVRNCRFLKTRDRFLYELYPQNDCAYQVYSPGKGGTFTGNFAKGYFSGIFIKAGDGKYVIRHNTIVDAHTGIMWVTGNADSDTSYNVIVNANEFVNVGRFAPTFTMDCNLYWHPKQPSAFANRTEVVRGANRDKLSLLADPRFVDPANGDYRLLPDSPALRLKDAEGRPAGAFDVAPANAATNAKPTLALAFAFDTKSIGRTGEYTFERDPWIGGGRTFVRDLIEEDSLPTRLAGTTAVTVHLRAFDATGTITKMRVAVGDAIAPPAPYEPTHQLTLPENDGNHRIHVKVQNDRGAWSDPAQAIIRLDRQPPKFVEKPTVLANDNGLVVSFRTDEPCVAELIGGPDTVHTPALVKRFWDANDGGEWVETWKIARTNFALPLLKPNVKTGEKVKLRVLIRDEAGLKFESEEFTATVKGPPRTLAVSTTGNDAAGCGGKDQPFRTVQYAVDRALPGDRVVVAPGVYTEPVFLTHGGADDRARLTIEAEKPGTVTLDSAKRENALIHLEGAPFVTLRNLRVLYFKKSGVYAYRSPHITIEGCTFYNGPGWETGYHVFCFYSPRATLRRNLAIGAETGFVFVESPQATVESNTASQHMYAAAAYYFSAAGTVQKNNAFSFAGNDIYVIETHHPDELKTFRSDFNNLGTNVTEYNRAFEQGKPELWKQMKAEEFKTNYDGGRFLAGSKAIVGVGERYHTMKAWREFSRQDQHSIFADPQYAKPYAPLDRWDWRVKPGSPNLNSGENKTPIGAFAEAASQ